MTILSKFGLAPKGNPLGIPVKNNVVNDNTSNNEHCEDNQTDVNSLATLHRAIVKGKTEKVYKYLSQKEKWRKINKQDADGRSALHLICASGNVELLRLLVNINTIQLEIKDYQGKTPFFKAVESNAIGCMKELITHGAIVKTCDENGNTPLHCIAQNYSDEYKDILTYLVEKCKINLDLKNDHGFTPLHLAIRNGHTDVVQILAENKADLNLSDFGRTPLQVATEENQNSIVDILRYFGVTDKQHMKNVGDKSNEIFAMEMKLNELLKNRNEILLEKHQINDVNSCLDQEFKLSTNQKKRRNVIHCITKKSARLLAKYVPKQLYKHLNERERREESNKLQTKFSELEMEYEIASSRLNSLNEKLRFETYRKEQLMTSFDNSYDDVITKINEVNEDREREMGVVAKLRQTLEETKTKLAETKRKIDSFKGKSRDGSKQMKVEIEELKRANHEKDDQLEKFKNGGRLNDMKEELAQKKEEIEKGKVYENKLLEKLIMLKSRYAEAHKNNNN